MYFSVLISIYYRETPKYFNRSMISIWDEQSIKPSEIVLVQDGLLNDELYNIINEWTIKLGDVLKVISLEKNVGLGNALNIGLKHCRYELIARMDTDDIADSDRFKKQLNIFKNSSIDICSSWISEFDRDENLILSYRKVPEWQQEIMNYSKKRSPINHPAVMYRKSAVEKAGGYMKMMWFEDYYLWVRMLINNAEFYNIQEALVNMRAGDAQLDRRHGFHYAKSEVLLQKKFLNLGFINIFEFIRNVTIRFISRNLPKKILKQIYKRLRVEKNMEPYKK